VRADYLLLQQAVKVGLVPSKKRLLDGTERPDRNT